MAAKGYTTTAKVASFLGATFAAAQTTHCSELIERAEAAIDSYCGRAWLTGEQANEAHYAPTRLLYLEHPPVASVESITGRAGLGEDEETLVEEEDYEVRDLAAGLVVLLYPRRYDRVLATYTPVDEVPKDIEQAATELVATWMRPALQPGTHGVIAYDLPDLKVQFRSYASEAMPLTVTQLLDRHTFVGHA